MSALLLPTDFNKIIVITSEGELHSAAEGTAATPIHGSGGDKYPFTTVSDCKGLCPEEFVSLMYPPDLKLTYFKNEMKWDDEQIERNHQDALSFFRDAFGLDFFTGYNSGGELHVPGASLRPFNTRSLTPEEGGQGGGSVGGQGGGSVGGSKRQFSFLKQEAFGFSVTGFSNLLKGKSLSGGYLVKINTSTVMAHGVYGGVSGKSLPLHSLLIYGYFLLSGTALPQWFHFHSLAPIHPSINKAWTLQSEVIAFGSETWGRLEGLAVLEPRPLNQLQTEHLTIGANGYHISSRQVATFPGRL